MSGQPEWIPDESVDKCMGCQAKFTMFLRKHHCRVCGGIFCWRCSDHKLVLKQSDGPVRVCVSCFNKATRKPAGEVAEKKATVAQPVILQPDRVLYETRSLCTYCAVFDRAVAVGLGNLIGGNGSGSGNGGMNHITKNVSYLVQLNGEVYLYSQCTEHNEATVTLICGDAHFFHRMNLFAWNDRFANSIPQQLLAVDQRFSVQPNLASKKPADVYLAPFFARANAGKELVPGFSTANLLHRIRAPTCSYNEVTDFVPPKSMGYAGLPIVVEIDVCINGVFVDEATIHDEIEAIQLYYPPGVSFFVRLRAMGVAPNRMHILNAYVVMIDCLLNFPAVHVSLAALIKTSEELLATAASPQSAAAAAGAGSDSSSSKPCAYAALATRIRTAQNAKALKAHAPRAHILVASTVERIAHLALIPRSISCLRNPRVLPEIQCFITEKEAPRLGELINDALLALKLAFPTTQCIISLSMDSTHVLKAAESITAASSSPSIAIAAGAGVGSSASANEPLPNVASTTPIAAALESILGVALARTDLVRAVLVSQSRAAGNTIGRFAMRAALRTVDSFHATPILKGDSHLIAMRRAQQGLSIELPGSAMLRLVTPTSSTSASPTSPPGSPNGANSPTSSGVSPLANETSSMDALRSPESMNALLNAAKARILDQKLAMTAFNNANPNVVVESKDKKDATPPFQLIPESVDPIPLLAVLRAATKGAVTARDFIPLCAMQAISPLFEACGLGTLPLSTDPNTAFFTVLGHRSALVGTDAVSAGSASDPEGGAPSTSAQGVAAGVAGQQENKSNAASVAVAVASKELPTRFKNAMAVGCHTLADAFGTLPVAFSHISGVPPVYTVYGAGGQVNTSSTETAASAAGVSKHSATVNSVISLSRVFNLRALYDALLHLSAELEPSSDNVGAVRTFCEQLRSLLPSYAHASNLGLSAANQLAKLLASISFDDANGTQPASPEAPQPPASSAATTTASNNQAANITSPRTGLGFKGLQLLLVLNEGDFASVDMIRRSRPFAVRAVPTDLDSATLAASIAASRVQFVSAATGFV